MKTPYQKRYKNGFEYPMLKALGLNKPTSRIKAFYLILITIILIFSLL
jgi:hypothetical protein